MAKFNVDVEVREINRYEYTVEAESAEEAEKKLRAYLDETMPYVFDRNYDKGIFCDDRESGMVTEDIISVKVK